jgi:enterochelin esterase-like enzyme
MEKTLSLFVAILFIFSCKHIQQREDELYSRHLNRKVKLEVINSPGPADKSGLNLLLLNDGQDMEKLRVFEITDSLYKKRALQPLVIVAVYAGDRTQEYGVSGKPDYLARGSKVACYDSFIIHELLPYAKKISGIRKFNSIAKVVRLAVYRLLI